MGRRKREGAEEVWIDAEQAAAILTRHTDHVVTANYVRLLAHKQGKIRFRARNKREHEYLKRDAEEYRVRLRNAPRVRPRPSTRKPPQTAPEHEQQQQQDASAALVS